MSVHLSYLDHNATAPLLPSARAAMVAALDFRANPSSVHAPGRAARRVVEDARGKVAALVGAKPGGVVFTSGATEAASMLLTPDWRMGRGRARMSRLYVSGSDHQCLLGGGRFSRDQVEILPVDADGLLRLDMLEAALARYDRASGLPLVAVHAANNETGVIQPWIDIARLVKAAGGVFVLDAVQAAGRLPLDISEGCADFIILSSHKIGGPMGAGAIVSASDVLMPAPLVTGGGQERGHRAGTENVAAIAGFGAAAVEAVAGLADMGSVAGLRDRFAEAVLALAPHATIFGANAPRLPNTLCFAIPGMKAETAQIAFDLDGVALSAGSACSSGKVGPSHVLKAMAYAGSEGGLRVSIGRGTTEADLARFDAVLGRLLARIAPGADRDAA